jgi:hypothetical protein
LSMVSRNCSRLLFRPYFSKLPWLVNVICRIVLPIQLQLYPSWLWIGDLCRGSLDRRAIVLGLRLLLGTCNTGHDNNPTCGEPLHALRKIPSASTRSAQNPAAGLPLLPGSDDVPLQPLSFRACLNFITQSNLRKEWFCSDGYASHASPESRLAYGRTGAAPARCKDHVHDATARHRRDTPRSPGLLTLSTTICGCNGATLCRTSQGMGERPTEQATVHQESGRIARNSPRRWQSFRGRSSEPSRTAHRRSFLIYSLNSLQRAKYIRKVHQECLRRIYQLVHAVGY